MQNTTEVKLYPVIRAIKKGKLIPFLGAGVNLCDRPAGTSWQAGQHQYLPDGGELARYLAKNFNYPEADDLKRPDFLTRVSQYIALVGGGTGALYEELHELLDVNYPPTLLHKLLAVLPRISFENCPAAGCKLIVTTNYDDVLERTFFAGRQPFDLVSYVAEGANRGKFWHWHFAPDPAQNDPSAVEAFWARWPPEIAPKLIGRPNSYYGLSLDQYPVILKIHGAVDRITPQGHDERFDSFVITEDNYIDYLARNDLSTLIPASLAAIMRRSNFLFLGYSLRDWNLRVILRRIWGEQKLKYTSWAIQLNPEELEQKFWQRSEIEIINAHLLEYARQLIALLQAEQAISDLEDCLLKLDAQS